MLKLVLIGSAALAILAVGALATMGTLSRNGSAPGVVDGRLTPCRPAPNCVSSEDGTGADKLVAPLPTDIWDRLPATIVALGGRVIVKTDTYFAAEFASALFGFVDDVELRLAADAVHIRSGSRIGYSDAGANQARVTAIRAALTN